VLVEAQLAFGAQHAPQLAQRTALVRDAAEDEADDGGVELCVRERQRVRKAGDDRDRHRGRCLLSQPSQGRLRLDRDDLGHRRRIVGEVAPVARADLDHAPGEAVHEPAAMLRCTARVGARGRAGVDLSEPRVLGIHRSAGFSARRL
jgi:hypothetical protein